VIRRPHPKPSHPLNTHPEANETALLNEPHPSKFVYFSEMNQNLVPKLFPIPLRLLLPHPFRALQFPKTFPIPQFSNILFLKILMQNLKILVKLDSNSVLIAEAVRDLAVYRVKMCDRYFHTVYSTVVLHFLLLLNRFTSVILLLLVEGTQFHVEAVVIRNWKHDQLLPQILKNSNLTILSLKLKTFSSLHVLSDMCES